MITSLKQNHRAYPLKPLLIFILCLALLALLNLGLHTLLEPPTHSVSTLPYSIETSLEWEVIKGNWKKTDAVIEQQGYDPGLLVSPLRIDPEGIRMVLTLEPGAGIAFAMRNAHQRLESHWLMLTTDSLAAGFMTADSTLVEQAKVTLPESEKPHYITLLILNHHYTVLLDDTRVMAELPLNYSGQSLGFISTGPTRIYGLLIDRQINAP
jgi:hypothetical protein